MSGGASAEQEPQRYTGFLIRRAQQLHVAAWSRLVSTETSSVQYSILVVLDQRGPLSQRKICDAVDLDRSTVADLLARMERRGLVAREPDPADGRRKTVTLTGTGSAERRRLRPRVEAVEEELTGALPPRIRDDLRVGLQALLARPSHSSDG